MRENCAVSPTRRTRGLGWTRASLEVLPCRFPAAKRRSCGRRHRRAGRRGRCPARWWLQGRRVIDNPVGVGRFDRLGGVESARVRRPVLCLVVPAVPRTSSALAWAASRPILPTHPVRPATEFTSTRLPREPTEGCRQILRAPVRRHRSRSSRRCFGRSDRCAQVIVTCPQRTGPAAVGESHGRRRSAGWAGDRKWTRSGADW